MSSSIDRRQFLEATALSLGALSAARGLTAAPTDEDPLGIRADFPITREQAYLNTSSVGPIPRVVRDAALDYADRKMLSPDKSRADVLEAAREGFADLFGAKKEEIAILYSTSDGENVAARALDLRAGDNVVLDELHFTTSFLLYRELEEELGIELRIVPHVDGRARLEDFDARIDDRTRLVSVAWVSNRNGYRQDLRALSDLAHAKGALVYADGIQAIGTFPTNLHETGCDFMCTGTYKWLFASFGAAPFYVREEHLDRIRPDRWGHGQIVTELPDFRYEIQETAAKYEYAAHAYAAVFMLRTALDYLKGVGLERIERHTGALAARLRESVAELGFDMFTPKGNPSPIVSFLHGRDPEEVQKRLDQEAVHVTLREQGKLLRVGVAAFNNESDVQQLLKVLSALA